MTNRETLLALADRVEALTGPNYAIETEIAAAIGLPTGIHVKNYTASIDAAMTLVPEGWVIGVMSWWPCSQSSTVHMDNKRGLKAMSGASSLPQALVAACLRAHAGEA